MLVRKYLLAAASAAAIATIATPAAARDGSGYIAFDAGLMWSKSSLNSDFSDSYYCDNYFDNYFTDCHIGAGSKNKMGYDIDVRGGYDFECSGWKARSPIRRRSVSGIHSSPTNSTSKLGAGLRTGP